MTRSTPRPQLYLGFWGFIDYWAHRLHLPRRIRYWVCDRYDAWLDPDGEF